MAEFVVTGPDGKEYEVTAPDGASQASIIRQVQSYIDANAAPPEPVEEESPGFMRRTGDVATSVVTGIPKAVGALASLGSSVPYVNVVTDPIAQGLYDLGEYGDDVLLSDYQQQQNKILSARIQEAAAQLDQISEDASLTEKMEFVYDTMIAQGGEAAEYIAENPSQTFNLIGQTLPHIFLGGAVGKGLKTAGAVKNAGTAGAIGEGAIAAGDSVGSIVRDQRAEGNYDYDPNRLYGLAAGATTGLISRGGSVLNPVDIDTLAAGGARDLLGTGTGGLVKNTAKGLATEGAEEFLQSGQEQAFTNLGTGDPVYEGVGSSAVLGAATGAPLGAGVNLYSSLQDNPREQIDEQTANENALQEQQLRDEQQQQEADEARRVGLARANAARDFVPFKTFEAKKNEAQLASVLDPASEVNEEFMVWVANTRGPNKPYPQTEAEFKKEAKDFIKDNSDGTESDVAWEEYQAQLDDHVAFKEAAALRSPEETAQATQTSTDLLARRATAQQTNDVDALAALEEEAATALTPGEWRNAKYVADGLAGKPKGKDAPQKPVAPEAGTAPNVEVAQAPEVDAQTTAPEAPVAPKAPTKRELLYQETTELLGENWEESNADLSQLISDGKSIYPKKKGEKSRFEKMREKVLAEQAPPEAPAIDTTPVEQPEVQDTAPEQPQATDDSSPAAEDNLETMAVKYIEDKVGPNWRTERPELVPLLEEGEFAGLQANVDRIVAEAPEQAPEETEAVEPEPMPEEAAVVEAETATAVDNLFAEPLPPEVKLSANEQKVFDVLNEAFQNNEQDDVVQADGSLNPQRIADRAGLNSRQAAQTAITRLRPKIAKAYGLDQKQIKQRLAETRTQNVEAFDQNADDSQVELQELGDSMGTIASANQGARDGMAAEDEAFLDDMEETPIQEQTPEQLSAVRQEIDVEVRADRAYIPAQETWDNGFEADVENEADRISFETLDAGSRFEWLHYFTEYNRGNFGIDELGQYYDDIRADYIKDNQNAELEATDEVGQIESGTDPQEAGRDDSQVREEGGQATERPAQEDSSQLTAEQFKERAAKVEVKTKKKRTITKPPVEAQDAKRQAQDKELEAVDAVATKLGGEVVYQQGDIALVRGYSAVSGAPVYSAAKGSMFTNVDVDSYKGDQFSAEQLAELKKAKQDAEAEAQRVHEETPFVTYSNGLAFSGSVTPEVQGIVSEWKGLLGLGSDVYVTTLEDAKADKLNFTGPLRAVGSGTLNPNERGSTRRLSDGSHYIIFDAQASKVGTLETIAHEMGHVHQKAVFDQATPEVKQALLDAHGDWLRSQTSSTAKELVKSLRARKTGKTTEIANDLPFNQIAPYWKSFSEWYADQTSRWATTQSKPVSVVERFFSRLGKAMKSFYDKLANKQYLPDDAFVEYLDKVKDVNLTDPMNDDVGSQADAMAGSMEPTPEQESKTNKALGKVMGGEAKAAQLTANVKQAYKTPLSSLKPISRVVRDNKEAMPSAARFQESLYQQEQTIQEELLKVEEILLATRDLSPTELAEMNDFISQSTFYQKWGYATKIDGKDVKVDPVMKRKFEKLAPAAQETAKSIFAYNEDMRKAMQKEAEDRGVKGVFKASKLKGPYAPLKRFGKYVTVLKSQDVLDLEAKLKETPKDRQAAKKLDELKSKEEHYVVSFFDTMGEAVKFKEQNKARYAPGKDGAQSSEKDVGEFENRVTNPEAFAAVMGAIGADDKAGLDDTTKQNVQKIVEKLFYETLDEQSARLSGAKRENRAGYEKDMVRSFVSHAQSQARLLAQLRHGAEINQALRDMKQEARGNREELQQVANILQLKYNNLLTRDERGFAALQDSITSFNSMYMLTTNVAYHVANATQPAISQAKIAGDFGNYSGAWGALTRGYKEAKDVIDSSLLKQLGTVTTVGMIDMGNTVQLNVENAKPEHRALLKKLQLRQMLDVGLEQDLNMETMFDTGYEILNKTSKGFKDMSHRLYQSARYVEAYNRVAVAVAAYDMAVRNPAATRRMKMTPEEYAISIVEDTQGNYSNMDAPLAFDSLPKVTTQFRKFQIIMGWLWGTTLRDALPMNGKSKEERAAARRTLAYLGLNVGSLAGVKGLPFAGFIGSAALMAFGDDDEEEPKDLERWMRENYENDLVVDVLMRGAPSLLGIDLSAKLQQSDIFLPLNPQYIDASPDAEVGKNVAFSLAFGPTAGTIGNIDRAYDQYARGDMSRAVEYLLPKGQRSALESLRFAQEGYSLKNGDVILDPTKFDMYELVKNALGLTPLELSKVKWTYGQQIELKNYFTDEQARMKREYKAAKLENDRATMKELRLEWRDLQKQKDRTRSFFNDDRKSIPRSPVSQLVAAGRDQRRREKRVRKRLGVD